MSRKKDLYLLSEAYVRVNEGLTDVLAAGGRAMHGLPPKPQQPAQPQQPSKQGENAEDGGPALDPKTGEAEDWRPWMTRNIVKSGSDFLRKVYELGYTGEAGDSDINEIVAQLAQEVEADDRLKRALEEVVVHMVNAGHADF